MMRRLRFVLSCLLLALAGCGKPPQPARPALWEVTGPQGQKGWLFGTIHALDHPADWHSPTIDGALLKADTMVVEVANVGDRAALAQAFTALSRTPGLPPLSRRVTPAQRPALMRLYKRTGFDDARLTDVETWAAAVTLAQASNPDMSSSHGVDQEVLAAGLGKAVVELEGAGVQLGLFDRLPEIEQRQLLGYVLADEAALGNDDASLAGAWRMGDMKAIAHETRRGMLADPELRAVLLTGRNQAWTTRIDALLTEGKRPFVAVGAAHMAGPQGLPALLAVRGYAVRRMQ